MKKNIRLGLSTAACALIHQVPSTALAENAKSIGEWDYQSAVLFYSEFDRVNVIEPVISGTKTIDTDESIGFKLTYDTLSGASGSGAAPTSQPQTFTRPSGGGQFTTASGQIPLDDTFEDDRIALNLSWTKPGLKGSSAQYGINVSDEYDYTSLGASARLAFNFNNANTTISTGLSFSHDMINPVGGVPEVFASVRPAGQEPARSGSRETKQVVDALAGITQVINRNSLVQFNYSLSIASGYMNDPYKVLSVVQDVSGQPVFNNLSATILPLTIYENRPDSRIKHSLYSQYKRFISGNVFSGAYRLMQDSWGILSHTLDFKYRMRFGERHFLQPHLRLYNQSAADFYRPFLRQSQQPDNGELQTHASADYRLGAFNGYTIGVEYGQDNLQNSWSVALEYYLQSGNEPSGKFGELANVELYPDVSAVMVKLFYDF